VIYYFRELKFEGLETISEKQAKAYFVETGALLKLKSTRIYTPERLARSVANLTEILERAGYESAKVTVDDVKGDDRTGAVQARIQVHQGPKSIVRSVQERFYFEGETNHTESKTVFPLQRAY